MAEKDDQAPKLHIDADWKAAAQAEKERLAEREQARETESRDRGLPEASMMTLIDVLASQAIMGLGAVADPKSGGAIVDLPGAKFSIDLLQIIDEKTKGNLSEEESTHLTQIMHELRSRFVQIAQLVAQQRGVGGGGEEQPPKAEGDTSRIIHEP